MVDLKKAEASYQCLQIWDPSDPPCSQGFFVFALVKRVSFAKVDGVMKENGTTMMSKEPLSRDTCSHSSCI